MIATAMPTTATKDPGWRKRDLCSMYKTAR
jgi:hypothetical protein